MIHDLLARGAARLDPRLGVQLLCPLATAELELFPKPFRAQSSRTPPRLARWPRSAPDLQPAPVHPTRCVSGDSFRMEHAFNCVGCSAAASRPWTVRSSSVHTYQSDVALQADATSPAKQERAARAEEGSYNDDKHHSAQMQNASDVSHQSQYTVFRIVDYSSTLILSYMAYRLGAPRSSCSPHLRFPFVRCRTPPDYVRALRYAGYCPHRGTVAVQYRLAQLWTIRGALTICFNSSPDTTQYMLRKQRYQTGMTASA